MIFHCLSLSLEEVCWSSRLLSVDENVNLHLGIIWCIWMVIVWGSGLRRLKIYVLILLSLVTLITSFPLGWMMKWFGSIIVHFFFNSASIRYSEYQIYPSTSLLCRWTSTTWRSIFLLFWMLQYKLECVDRWTLLNQDWIRFAFVMLVRSKESGLFGYAQIMTCLLFGCIVATSNLGKSDVTGPNYRRSTLKTS